MSNLRWSHKELVSSIILRVIMWELRLPQPFHTKGSNNKSNRVPIISNDIKY